MGEFTSGIDDAQVAGRVAQVAMPTAAPQVVFRPAPAFSP